MRSTDVAHDLPARRELPQPTLCEGWSGGVGAVRMDGQNRVVGRSLTVLSRPEVRRYLVDGENCTEHTSAPLCAFRMVLMHLLETPSQIFTEPSCGTQKKTFQSTTERQKPPLLCPLFIPVRQRRRCCLVSTIGPAKERNRGAMARALDVARGCSIHFIHGNSLGCRVQSGASGSQQTRRL